MKNTIPKEILDTLQKAAERFALVMYLNDKESYTKVRAPYEAAMIKAQRYGMTTSERTKFVDKAARKAIKEYQEMIA